MWYTLFAFGRERLPAGFIDSYKYDCEASYHQKIFAVYHYGGGYYDH